MSLDIDEAMQYSNHPLGFVPSGARKHHWSEIIAAVAERHGFEPHHLIANDRRPRLVVARQHAMWALRQTGLSFPRIGYRLGGRNHATVMHGVRRHEQRMAGR